MFSPSSSSQIKRVGYRVEDGLKDGDGEVGWKPLRKVAKGSY